MKALHLREGENIRVEIVDEGNIISIELKALNKQELPGLRKQGEATCTAIIEISLEEKLEHEFKEASDKTSIEIKFELSKIRTQLSRIIDTMVYNFRWTFGVENSHDPILAKYGPFWSFNNKIWLSLKKPIATDLIIKWGLPMSKISQKQINLLQDLLQRKINEPIGHEMFSEAWEIRNSNPRSSLIIGIAAIEAGFAACVTTLVPNAGWLINKIPSPPLVDMLKNYLPLLPCKNQVIDKAVPPPSSIRKILDKAIENRNQIAHGRVNTLKKDFDLEEFLRSARDILYLLDYYCGHAWASDKLRPDVAKNIIDVAKKMGEE